MLTRRTLLPMIAAIPFPRNIPKTGPSESVPRIPETRLILGGDVMLSRSVGKFARQRGDSSLPLRELGPELASADIAFVNLEAPFSDRGKLVESGMIFKAEPEMIGALQVGGIDIVSTANNHARDCGGYGVGFTLDWLADHGIATVGSAKSADDAHAGTVLTRNGTRFGFLAYTYDQSNGNHRDVDDRIAVLNVGQMRRDVAAMLGRSDEADGVEKARADVVIVSMHAGIEYSPQPNHQQTEFAHAAMDAGARVVVGHHPHVVQPWERVGDGVVFYSLGNLVFDQFQREETQHGALAKLTFSGARLVHAERVPVDIARTGPRLAGASSRAAGGAGDKAGKAR
jgi:poly-gamma-glutamate capsule biosynthesis protein CapA/YwtB (metallophosphatase superfamily)